MFFLYAPLLFLLFIPLGFFIYGFRKKFTPVESIFSKTMQKKLFFYSGMLSKHLKNRLFLLIITLLIIALVRPVKRLDTLDVQVSKATVILALDVSKSMHENDVYPSRIVLAEKKLKLFIDNATGLNIGILLYANDAYMLYPVSQNPEILLTLLEEGKVPNTFKENSNLFSALEGSTQLLEGYKNQHIVLFSDGGEEVDRGKELNYLQKQHIILSTLALKPNKAMEKLVKVTKGSYQAYTWGSGDVNALVNAIKASKRTSASYQYDIAQYKEYFQYPLALAVLLLLLFYLPLEKKKLSFVVFLYVSMGSFSTPLNAGVFDFWYLHKAKASYSQKNYKKAIEYYKSADLTTKGYYNLATSYYRNKEYLKAIKAYKKSLKSRKALNLKQGKQREAKIYHNIATCYVRMRKFDFAKQEYIKSLSLYYSKESSENLKEMISLLKVQRKNLHKKYQKIEFKGIGKNSYASESMFSNYAIKLNPMIPSEEEKWFSRISKEKSPFYLQKLITHQRSLDANLSY